MIDGCRLAAETALLFSHTPADDATLALTHSVELFIERNRLAVLTVERAGLP